MPGRRASRPTPCRPRSPSWWWTERPSPTSFEPLQPAALVAFRGVQGAEALAPSLKGRRNLCQLLRNEGGGYSIRRRSTTDLAQENEVLARFVGHNFSC